MFIIGIGASAGGLQALTAFFGEKQHANGESYVVIFHSLRTYESQLVRILQRITPIECGFITDGMEIQSGKIYVSPPSDVVSIIDGKFHLVQRDEEDKINHTIDSFFDSLAMFARANAIGVIMSGTGTDGTNGSRKIEDHGGVVIVQDPETAQFDGMPLTSIRYDHPDYILPPNEMPQLIDRIIRGEEKTNERKLRNLSYD